LRGSLMVSHSYHMSKQIEHAIYQSQTANQGDVVSQNEEIKEQAVETIADAEIIEEYPSKGEVK
ncbi:MAG: hypothetical protein R3261_05320, partial [Alphaproteobacteria bacterium]|nr:hypothetical protein [Alphaproteobacteria bacterium]